MSSQDHGVFAMFLVFGLFSIIMLAHFGDIGGYGGAIVGCAAMIFMIAVLLAFYFIPTLIAFHREHEQRVPLFIVNLLLGWILIPWVLCLAWAFFNKKEGHS